MGEAKTEERSKAFNIIRLEEHGALVCFSLVQQHESELFQKIQRGVMAYMYSHIVRTDVQTDRQTKQAIKLCQHWERSQPRTNNEVIIPIFFFYSTHRTKQASVQGV